MSERRLTQTSEILRYMKEHQYITSKIAYEYFGATRLAAIIFNLRKLGYIIDTVMVEGSTRYGSVTQYARYFYRGRVEQND